MGWEQEYEHLRDKGKTWGPGIDDGREQTEEELINRRLKREAYRKKLDDAAVAPREEFVKAGEELKNRFSTDEIFRSSSLMKEFCTAEMELCKKACELLGYKFNFPDQVWGLGEHKKANEKERSFSVSVEYLGWLEHRGGNLHQFFVCGINSLDDCLQLVADFSAIGLTPTTWYGKDFHCTLRHTGELYYELIRAFGEDEFKKGSVGDIIRDANERTDNNLSHSKEKDFNFDVDKEL